MLAGLIILATLVALFLLIAVVQRRRSVGDQRQLTSRSAELDRTRSELSEAIDRAREAETELGDAQRNLEDAEDKATSQNEEVSRLDQKTEALHQSKAALASEITELKEDLVSLNEELDAGDRLAADQSAELASMAIEAEDFISRIGALEGEVANRVQPFGSVSSSEDAPDPTILWQLELARSERTWRYSVAMFPDDASPFADTDDALRLAVETESAALRDEVGAFLSVEWKIAPIASSGLAHLVLRVAQEMLAQAARVEEPTALVATYDSDDNIELRLVPTEDGDDPTIDLRQFENLGPCTEGIVFCDAEGAAAITVVTD
jgi:archaellum component FlaC